MKKELFRITLSAMIIYLTSGTFNVAVAATQPSGGNGTHFCGVTDVHSNKQYLNQFPNRHYARTLAANLNTGEPRTVRLIYFLPNDRPYREEAVQRMKNEILSIQAFYAEAMQAHGYDMTFKIETDTQGMLVVHRVDGQQTDLFYIDNASETVRTEISQVFDFKQNIYFIVIDSSFDRIGTGLGKATVKANGGPQGKNGGTVLIPVKHFEDRIERDTLGYDKLAAHEIGHAFGLQHDFRNGGYIMSYGRPSRGQYNKSRQDRLSACNADYLAVNPFFNSNIPTEKGKSPTIELMSPSTYPSGSSTVNIQLKVNDSEGIHQVIMFVKTVGPLNPVGYPEVKAYHKLTGEKEEIVSFEYDGDIPSTSFTKLSFYSIHRIDIAAIDINGNIYYKTFTLSEKPSNQVDPIMSMKILGYKHEVRTEDYNYQTWDLPTWARIRIGKGGAENSAAFSPNGRYLAVASSIGIWLYDTVNYQELALLSSQYPITAIAFSPDGNAIVGVSYRRPSNQVWNIETKEKIATFQEGGNYTAAFLPDGKTIASASRHIITLWDVTTEQELMRIKSEVFINAMSVSYDGKMIACAGRDGLIKLWEVLTGNLINTFGHDAHINSIAFSPTENIIASGSSDTTVKLWDAMTGAEIFTIESRGVISTVAFSHDGKILAWADGKTPDIIILYDVETKSIIATYEDPTVWNILSISFSPDGNTFVTADGHWNVVKVWDINTGNTIDLGHVGLTPISFSPDSLTFATGGRAGVKLWDVNTGENVVSIPVQPNPHVRLVSFSPDGEIIAYRVSGEKFTRLWDVTTQTESGIIENPSITCWAFSPDGKTLASDEKNKIKLWDVETKQNIDTLEGHLKEILSLSYSPDGNTLASASRDRTMRLWDIETKKTIKTFEPSRYYSFKYATFSLDGTTLVIQQNGRIKLYNLVTQNMAIVDEDDFMTFLPNSSMMILRSTNITSGDSFSVWDAKTATLVTTLDPELLNGWRQPTFSPDGKTLAISNSDSTILFDPELLYSQLPPLAPANINFFWSIPAGISLIHVPLKVKAVDGVEQKVASVADLYDALGGESVVNFLIIYDPHTQAWRSYFSSPDRGSAADMALADDTAIVAGIKTPVILQLTGDALGTSGSGAIALYQGLNLVGLPLNNPDLTRVSDLLGLDGIRGNVPVIIGTDGGEFQAVGRAGDPGDILLTGGQGFILTAQQAATVAISGEAWTNTSGGAAPTPVVLKGIDTGDTTPILALRGVVVDEVSGLKLKDIHVTAKNLSTDSTAVVVTAPDTGEYRLTFVDIETSRAATVGDTFEIAPQSSNPFISVEPLRYTVTAEDVKQSLIQLPELVAYEIPAETQLLANYPNPFNPETWIPYRLAEDAFVTLTIYDLNGQIVRTLDVGHQVAAVYEGRSKAVYWDGRNGLGEQVASGIYFYHLSAGDYSATRKMVILK